DLASFWRQNWSNGVWAILPFLYSTVMPVSWRHLAPLGLVVALLGSAGLALAAPAGRWLLGGLGGAYLAATLAASIHVAWRERDLKYLVVMPIVFATLHFAYGLGSLWGVAQAGRVLLSRARGTHPAPERGPG